MINLVHSDDNGTYMKLWQLWLWCFNIVVRGKVYLEYHSLNLAKGASRLKRKSNYCWHNIWTFLLWRFDVTLFWHIVNSCILSFFPISFLLDLTFICLWGVVGGQTIIYFILPFSITRKYYHIMIVTIRILQEETLLLLLFYSFDIIYK